MNIAHSRPTLVAADAEAVCAVLETGYIARGQRVAEFERAVSAFLGLADGTAEGGYPGAARLFDETVSPPIWPTLTDEMQDHVCGTLREALR